MTTILKAVRELEGRGAGADASADASHEDRRWRRRSLTGVLLAVIAGVLGGGALLWLRAPLGPASSPPDPARPQVVSGRASKAPQLPVSPIENEAPPGAVKPAGPAQGRATEDGAPWGKVEKRAATALTAAQLAPTDPHAIAAPRPALRPGGVTASTPARPMPRTAPSGSRAGMRQGKPRREATARQPGEGPAAARDDREARSPMSGGTGVRVLSIAYSPDVAERTAALRIDGQTVTLHQGESASGLEVQLILPRSVYLRRGGDIFAVDAGH